MVQDPSMQIFLTIYFGQLLATFFYDYIVRNSVRLFYHAIQWDLLTNVLIGVIFIVFIVWAILSVWSKIRRNLIVTACALILMLIIRLAVGIPSLMDSRRRSIVTEQMYTEELVVFIVQILVHVVGIVCTWLLATNQSGSL